MIEQSIKTYTCPENLFHKENLLMRKKTQIFFLWQRENSSEHVLSQCHYSGLFLLLWMVLLLPPVLPTWLKIDGGQMAWENVSCFLHDRLLLIHAAWIEALFLVKCVFYFSYDFVSTCHLDVKRGTFLLNHLHSVILCMVLWLNTK